MATLTTSYQKIAEKRLGLVYGSNNYAYIRVYAKYNSQSTANNTTNISVQARLYNDQTWYASSGTSYRITASGGLDSGTISCNRSSSNMWAKGEVTLGTVTGDVKHNDDGTRTMHGECRFISSPWGWDVTAQGSDITIPTIPRYANITGFAVHKVDETSVRYDFSYDAECDYAWYSINNGSTWNALPTTNIVSGLSAGTTYNFKLRVRRKDSQLTTDSGTVPQETYYYPHCTETPNFTLGTGITLKFYNPLNRTFKVNFIGNGTQIAYTWENVSGISLYCLDGTTTQGQMYATIPDKTEGFYKVKVTYGTHTETRDVGSKYYINVNDCKPNFSDFDISTNLSELTGNTNTIINKKTTSTITIPANKKATGKYSATIKKYRIECGSLSPKEITYSNTSEVSDILENCDAKTIKVTAIDSRGLEKTVPKDVTNYLTYVKPSFAEIAIQRKDGVDTETNLDTRINFWNGNFGAGNNKITELVYRSKAVSGSYTKWYDIDLDSLVYNENEVSLTDYLIHANGENGGFTIGVSYNVQLKVSDGLDTYTFETVTGPAVGLTDGKVGFSLLKDNDGNYHAGINNMPHLDYAMVISNGAIKVDDIKSKNLLFTPYTEDNKLTMTAEHTDHYWTTGYYCYLESGKKYTFSCETDGVWGAVETFLLKDRAYDVYYHMDNKVHTFTPSSTGYYYLRYDINDAGATYSFWNFQIEEGGSASGFVVAKEFSNLQHYSRDEEIIGTYVNGKPLYRKSISFSDLEHGHRVIQHWIENVDMITIVDPSFIHGYSTNYYPVNSYGNAENDSHYLTFANVNATNINVFCGQYLTGNGKFWGLITVEYTKTTD